MRKSFVVWCLVLLASSPACGLRIVSYNTATSGDNMLPTLPRPGMSTVLAGIGNETVQGIAGPLDVLLLQEQDELATSTQAIVDVLNNLYGDDIYARGRRSGKTNGGGRGAIIYNTQTVELVAEASFGTLSGSAQARETMRYTLRPVGYGDDANFFAYVNHYKAGSTATDQTRRNVEATAVRANADRLGENTHVIYAGDFNIRSCAETMFRTLTGGGDGQAIDPVGFDGTNCNWHNNDALREWHTQSPADGRVASLVQGGMDDRFDFQLVTDDFLDGEGLSLVDGSYRTFGNNGTHRLNQPVNSTQNTATTRTIVNALAQTSDHLPVVVDYQIPSWMNVTTSNIPSQIIRGTAISYDVDIANVAPVTHPNAADELDYRLVFEIDTPDNAQVVEGIVNATTSQRVALTLPTDQARNRVYRLRVESDSESVVDGSFLDSGFYSVVAPAVPSWSPEAQVTERTIDLGFVPLATDLAAGQDNTLLEVPLAVHNLLTVEQTAALQFDSFEDSPADDAISLTLEPFDLLSRGEAFDFKAVLDTTAIGTFASTLTLNVSDDRSIFGATETQMVVDIVARVAIPGDANGDNNVAFDDFLVVSRSFGNTDAGWTDGDFDQDQQVAFSDFLLLARNFGFTAPSIATPEPASGLSMTLALAILPAFRRKADRRKAD